MSTILSSINLLILMLFCFYNCRWKVRILLEVKIENNILSRLVCPNMFEYMTCVLVSLTKTHFNRR